MSDSETSLKRKNPREYIDRPLPKKLRAQLSGRQLSAGQKGFLLTFQSDRKSESIRESYSLLNEYADQFFPISVPESAKNPSQEEPDIESELRAECAGLRSRSGATSSVPQHRFFALDSGVKGVLFIRCDSPSITPSSFVHLLLKDLLSTKKPRSRHLLRLLPVDFSCRAHLRDMEEGVSSLLSSLPSDPSFDTYAVDVKIRNNSDLTRQAVLDSVCSVIKALKPLSRVKLSEPQFTVMVEVLKTTCCLALLQEYDLLRKYNVEEVCRVK